MVKTILLHRLLGGWLILLSADCNCSIVSCLYKTDDQTDQVKPFEKHQAASAILLARNLVIQIYSQRGEPPSILSYDLMSVIFQHDLSKLLYG
ncbi:hypothetical protein D3C77_484780 [compost metagenome]